MVTIALTVAWWLRIPHRVWPEHPQVADLLMGLALGIVLQILWAAKRTAE